MSTNKPDVEKIEELAVDIEQKIAENEELLEELPEYEERRKSNTVQLRKVVDGDIDGVVINDE